MTRLEWATGRRDSASPAPDPGRGTFSIVIILIEKRGLWVLIRRVLPDDLVPIAHRRRRTSGRP